eukprot:742-Eustigmatos_ZCMA.PRE.1
MPCHLTAIERVEQRQRAQKHALARARRPGKRNAIPRLYDERCRLQQRDTGACVVALEVGGSQHGGAR